MLPLAMLPLLAGACGDLPLLGSADAREPKRLVIELPPGPFTTGDTVPFSFSVRDVAGTPFEPMPSWAVLEWHSSGNVVELTPHGLVAIASGETTFTIRLSGLHVSTRLRVNPTSLKTGVAAAYITQAVQQRDGSVPLIADRDGYLRVFVTGDQPNFFRPTVRAYIHHDGVHVTTLTTRASDEGVPVSVDEGVLGRSWNMYVPGALIRPGMALRVEIDTDGGLRAGPGSTLHWPADGAPHALDVRTVAPLRVTFVPIHSIGVATGDISTTNLDRYLDATRSVWPLAEIDAIVREPYTTETIAVEDGWVKLVSEIRVLRIAEGSNRYYHGIVRRVGTWSGIGYVGYPVSVSSDVASSATPEWTVAHEFGHNFGRRHAPCGNPGGPDPAFPQADGSIGAYGLSRDGTRVYPPTAPDLMSYCKPRWVSGYSYTGVLEFRERRPDRGMSMRAAPAPTLVVSGRITPDSVVLDPAFSITTMPALPERAGPYTLEAVDAAGNVVFTVSFEGDVVADIPGDHRHFAFAVPLAEHDAARIVRLRLAGPAGAAERVAQTSHPMLQMVAGDAVRALRAQPGDVTLSWDGALFPLAVVRDAATGAILAFGRGGTARVRTAARELEVRLSDGTRSTMIRVTP